MRLKMQFLIKQISLIKYLFLFTTLLINSGCLITTQSFNHGKLLNPGERMVTTGLGWKYSARYFKKYEDVNNRDTNYNRSYFDSTRFGWFNFTYDYRIGVLRKYPFGKGLETGYRVECAYRGDRYYDDDEKEKYTFPEFYSPPYLEVDTRFGLPDITLKKGILHHNVNWGWLVGQWVDNGWFWGYAAGVEFIKAIVYGSVRCSISPTDVLNTNEKFYNIFLKHKRNHVVTFQCGSSIKLPLNESFLPEYITPEFSLMFPNFNRVQPVGFSFSIGIRWMPGF